MATNIIKINKYLEKFNTIEIRVEKVHNEEKGISFYFTYAFINKKIKLLGRSKFFPKIYKYNTFMKP